MPDRLDANMRRMEGRQRAYNQRQAEEDERRRASRSKQQDFLATHPGLVESMVPVWGSAREAIADAREGDVVGAIGNGVLAVTDLAPGGYAVKGLAKGAFKAGSHTWGATRKWMGKNGMLEAGQHGHHGIIPNNGWGKHVPDIIKNHPANITATRSPEEHMRIHGRYKGQPRYGVVERTWRGSPDWARAAASTWAPNGAVTSIDAATEDRGKRKQAAR